MVHRDELAAFSAVDGAFGDGYLAADLAGIAPERFQQVAGDSG